MPTITLNKRRLNSLLGKDIKDEELAYYLAMLGTDVESISKEEVVVEVFPNRPDMLSEEGLARALRYFIGIEKEIKKVNVREGKGKVYLSKEALAIRPYVRVGIVRGVNINEEALESLIQLQEKLHITHGRKRRKVSIGVHDIRNIEFPLYYKKVSSSYSFVPLGKKEKMSIKEILEKHEKGREYKHLTSEEKGFVVWEDNKGNVLAFPPIINGSITEITTSTRDIFVDVTGTKEREVEEALNIVIWHLLELGGQVEGVEIFEEGKRKGVYPDTNYRAIEVEEQYIRDVSGLDIKGKELNGLLLKMGMYREGEKIYYPPYRTDILHPLDIVEDIVIAYGYDKVKEEEHREGSIGEESEKNRIKREIRKVLVGMGGVEIKNYHLTNETIAFDLIGLKKEGVIKAKNPMNEEYNILRPSLFPLIMRNFSNNTRYEYPQFIFEIGSIFNIVKGKSKEEESLCVGYAGKDANFSKIKAILLRLFNDLGLSVQVRETHEVFLINGRAGEVIIGDKKLGWFGEVHPAVISNFGIEMPVVALEINVNKIIDIMMRK